MSSQTVLTALSSLVSILALCYLVFWRYRAYRIDAFRQNMFELRDELFDYANDGKIDFDHPAYGVLRSTINGFIRFGHRLTLWHLLFMNLFIRDEECAEIPTFSEAWEQATKKLNPEVKDHLSEYCKEMNRLVFKHLLTAAPEFFILLPLLLVVIIALVAWVVVTSLIYRKQQTLNAVHSILSRSSDAALLYGDSA